MEKHELQKRSGVKKKGANLKWFGQEEQAGKGGKGGIKLGRPLVDRFGGHKREKK